MPGTHQIGAYVFAGPHEFPRCLRPDDRVEDLVAAYRADLLAAGTFAAHPVTSPARSFLARVGVNGWDKLSTAEQC
jgi:hypothetical protein